MFHDKIASDNQVMGQCVLPRSLTSMVLLQGCFSPFLCVLGLPVEYKTSPGAQIMEWPNIVHVHGWALC